MASLLTVILCVTCLWTPVTAVNTPTVNDNYDYDRLLPDHLSPVIVTEPVSINTHPGETVTLDCHVTRLGNHSLTWRRGSDIISVFRGSHHQRVLKDRRYLPTIGNLTLFNVVGSDSGPYTCEVTTRPHPTTLTHTVNVYEAPSITATHPRLTPKEGGTATLECSFTGYPTPTVTWSRHDPSSPAAPPLLSSRTEGSISELVLTNVSRDDTGSYMCSAFSSFGPSSIATMDLAIMHAPIVTVENPVVHTDVGENAALICHVSAYPSVKVKWHHADTGAPIDPMRLKRQHRRKDRFFLHFAPVLLRDLGTYMCVASNQLGTDQGQVTLSAVPKLPVVVSDTHSNYTTEYMLLWEVESYEPILYYVINIRNATDPEEASLNITVPGIQSQYANYHSQKKEFTNLQPNSKYVVDILAVNKFGDNSLEFPFTFQTARADEESPDVVLDPDQQGSESSLEEEYDDGSYEDTYNHGADYEGRIDYYGGGGGDSAGDSGGGVGGSVGVDGGVGGEEGGGVGEKRKKPHRHHHRQRQQHKGRVQTSVHEENVNAELAPEQQQQRGAAPDDSTGPLPGDDDTAAGNSSLSPTNAASPAPPTFSSYPGLGAWLTVIVLSAFFC